MVSLDRGLKMFKWNKILLNRERLWILTASKAKDFLAKMSQVEKVDSLSCSHLLTASNSVVHNNYQIKVEWFCCNLFMKQSHFLALKMS